MIKPTIGRVVWYYPHGHTPEDNQPHAALIAFVWSDTCVNLAYFDQNGEAHNATSVLLYDEDSMPKPSTGYACWMPYQKGQAAKTDALETAAAARAAGPTGY